MNNKIENWPEYYPNKLQKQSWCINGEVAGPKISHVKSSLVKILKDKGITHSKEIDELCTYLSSQITIYNKDLENTFSVSTKKDKKTKKQTFSLEEWAKRLEACGMDKKFAKSFLTTMLKELVDFYNQMI